MSQKRTPQLGAAMALTQLLQENPDLPAISWSFSEEGSLTGMVLNENADMRAMVNRYADVLGGEISENQYASRDGRSMYSASLFVTWRDVKIRVSGACLVSSLPAEDPGGDPIAYGTAGIRCGCGKSAHSNLVPCRQQEDPHESPLRHDYLTPRDFPALPNQRDRWSA